MGLICLIVIYHGLMAETTTQLFIFSEEFLTPTVVGSYPRTPPTPPLPTASSNRGEVLRKPHDGPQRFLQRWAPSRSLCNGAMGPLINGRK